MSRKEISPKKQIVQAYEKISSSYLKLKSKPWKDFRAYLSVARKAVALPDEGIILDVGSGNGRNLLLFDEKKWQFIISDLSKKLLESAIILPAGRKHLLNNDMSLLPIKKDSIDLVLCIAALHHLENKKDTVKVLEDIHYSLKKGGYLILSCWRKWKADTRKKMLIDFLLYAFKKVKNRKWRHGDIIIPWLNEKKEVVAERYYHLFTKRELISLITKTNFKIKNISILGGKSKKDNLFFLVFKD
ncbi:MAG: class I SAM-dependent methyltransferase [Candidatus Heimdallarchaeaceae archaeon]